MPTLQDNQILIENEIGFPINLRDDEAQWVLAEACFVSRSEAAPVRSNAAQFYLAVLSDMLLSV